METLSRLQKRLCLLGGDAKFEHVQLVEWTTKFLRLFSVDEEKVSTSFIGTPAQLRAVLDELLVLAGRYGVSMETAIWAKYPNICPYCLTKPCSCGPRKARPHARLEVPLPEGGLTLGDLQRMLGGIYPNYTSLLQELMDVVVEVAESSQAAWTAKDPRQTEEEFADTFARLVHISNFIGVSLEGLIA